MAGRDTLTHVVVRLLQRTSKCISRAQAGRPGAHSLKLTCTGKWPLCSGRLPMLTPAYRPLCASPCSCGGPLTGSSANPWSSSTFQTQVRSRRVTGSRHEYGPGWLSSCSTWDLFSTATAAGMELRYSGVALRVHSQFNLYKCFYTHTVVKQLSLS